MSLDGSALPLDLLAVSPPWSPTYTLMRFPLIRWPMTRARPSTPRPRQRASPAMARNGRGRVRHFARALPAAELVGTLIEEMQAAS
jgi:hypothetical protein